MSHPAACLLAWLMVVLVLPFLGWLALVLAALGAFVFALRAPEMARRWLRLLRRSRFLLLSLWLILAYGTPGDAWHGWSWAPSDAGLDEAGQHVLRLVLMLATLAWLFATLPPLQLMAGLWSVLSWAMRPGEAWGWSPERLVVRLSLVFDYLEQAPPRGAWKQVLDERLRPELGKDLVTVSIPDWRPADVRILLLVALTLVALGVCP